MTDNPELPETGEQEPLQERRQGSRFFTCLVIAAVFIAIDLAILLYFFRFSTTSPDGEQGRGGVIREQEVTPVTPSLPLDKGK